MGFKVFQIDENKAYHTFASPDCNMINPIVHFGNTLQAINLHVDMVRAQSLPQYKELSEPAKREFASRLEQISKDRWQKQYENIINMPLPDNIKQLLLEQKKKAQQKIIKSLVFTSSSFISIPIHAWESLGMPYSKFTVDYLPKELDKKIIPAMLHKKDNGEFDYLGQTNMSEGEMRVAIDKRHRVIMEFIGDEKYWHCFFRTMAGIKGIEARHVGQPHLHYISSAWGISRAEVIERLSSYRYSLKVETIRFQPSDDTDPLYPSPV